MSITATNRIKTKREIEVVFNFHREICRDSITMTLYANGMQTTVFLTSQDALELQNAIDRTNREINEDTDYEAHDAQGTQSRTFERAGKRNRQD